VKLSIDKGPQPCSRSDCEDKLKPGDRFAVTLLLYSLDRSVRRSSFIHQCRSVPDVSPR